MAGKKLNILAFIDWYKPAFKAGGPVRSVGNLWDLLKKDVNLSIICGDTEIDKSKMGILSNEWTKLHSGEMVYYCQKPNFKTVRKWVKKNPKGVFYINGIYSLKFSFLPLIWILIFFHRNKVVVSPRGMLNEGAVKIKSNKKMIYLTFIRSIGLMTNVTWHATSEEEKNRIQKFFTKSADISVISNVPVSPVKLIDRAESQKGVLKMYSVSRVVPIKKLEVIVEAAKIRKTKSKIIFDVYGPQEDLKYVESLKSKSEGIENFDLFFKGPISPESLRNVANDYHLFCLPSANENFGHSIFEALASGTPVLISDKTPWHNLEQEKVGADIPLEDIQGFAEKLDFFAEMDDGQWQKWSDSAYDFAVRNYKKEEWLNEYLTLFANDINGKI